jgi:outer membrane protein W
MRIRNPIPGIVAALAVFAVCSLYPASADAGDGPWRLRLFAVSMNPTGDTVFVPDTDEQIYFDASGGYGGGMEIEYLVSRSVGIDFGALTASPVIDVLIDEVGVISASAQPRISPVYAGINFHLTPDSSVDLYLGPLFAYVVYSSFDLVTDPWFLREWFETENDWGIGINAGVDVRLGEGGWLLTAAFKYLDTTLVASPPDESIGRTDIDPMVFSIGVGYRF